MAPDRVHHDTPLDDDLADECSGLVAKFLLAPGRKLGQQQDRGLASLEGLRRLAQFDRDPGRCQIGIEPPGLRSPWNLLAVSLPHWCQIGIAPIRAWRLSQSPRGKG